MGKQTLKSLLDSIVLSAQAFDNILVDLFGKTCGIAFSFDSDAFTCVSSGDLSASPFGDRLMIATLGLLIVLILTMPLGLLDLDNNVELQLAWLVISGFIFLQWIVASIMFTRTPTYLENPVTIPLVDRGVDSLAGTIMLSLAFAFVIPSWVNIKKKDVDIQKSLWWSGIITLLMYLVIGLIPALCFAKDPATSGNILITLSQYGIPQSLTKITVYLFPIIMLLPSIPVSCIVSFDNIAQSDLCGKRTATLLAFVVPWICSIPLQTGGALGDFQNWASLIFVSTANFIIPILIYLKCVKFRGSYNKDRSVLTDKQLGILKKVHGLSKPIQQWVDFLSTVSEEAPDDKKMPKDDPLDALNNIIASGKVVVFSKSSCPYCVRASKILQQREIKARIVNLDSWENGNELQGQLVAKTGQSTLPNIFINGMHIGGSSELIELDHEGELTLEKINAPDFRIKTYLVAQVVRDELPDPITEDRDADFMRGLERGANPIVVELDAKQENRISTVALEYMDTSTSSINFEKFKRDVPDFQKRYSLPIEGKFKSSAFRSFPPWVTRRISARSIALGTMVTIVIVCISNLVILVKGLIEGDGVGLD